MGHLRGEGYRWMDRKRKKERGMERGFKEEGDCSVARARYLLLQIWYLTSPLCSPLLSPHQFSTSPVPSLNPCTVSSLYNIQVMSPCHDPHSGHVQNKCFRIFVKKDTHWAFSYSGLTLFTSVRCICAGATLNSTKTTAQMNGKSLVSKWFVSDITCSSGGLWHFIIHYY